MNPHEFTALIARGFRTADLALATTPGCKTVEQMTQSERDLLEVGIRAGIVACRASRRERKLRA